MDGAMVACTGARTHVHVHVRVTGPARVCDWSVNRLREWPGAAVLCELSMLLSVLEPRLCLYVTCL